MPSSVPDFAELLGRCERSAVHLELRDSYAPTDRFEAWKRGERIDWEDRASWWHPYDQLIKDAVSRGVAIRRARVVSEPVSDYIRWERSRAMELWQTDIVGGVKIRDQPEAKIVGPTATAGSSVLEVSAEPDGPSSLVVHVGGSAVVVGDGRLAVAGR